MGHPAWRSAKDWKFSYAFQPLISFSRGEVVAYEALIRGADGSSAADVFDRVRPRHLHDFDRHARHTASQIAGRLQLPCALHLNVLPGSLSEGERGVSRLVDVACAAGLDHEQLVLEVTEGEVIDDPVLLAEWVNAYRRRGIRIAIDDFGAGYAGLNLLADLQPDLIKLDIGLVRGIEGRGARQSIVRAIVQVSVDLGIDVVAEGVETEGELAWLADQGIDLFQGFLFARPGFECLPRVTFPVARVA